MATLSNTISGLTSAWQTLNQRWQSTAEGWNDNVRRAFEEQYWTNLDRQVHATQKQMEQLAEVIAKARQSVK